MDSNFDVLCCVFEGIGQEIRGLAGDWTGVGRGLDRGWMGVGQGQRWLAWGLDGIICGPGGGFNEAGTPSTSVYLIFCWADQPIK